jgi:hypothetical protein
MGCPSDSTRTRTTRCYASSLHVHSAHTQRGGCLQWRDCTSLIRQHIVFVLYERRAQLTDVHQTCGHPTRAPIHCCPHMATRQTVCRTNHPALNTVTLACIQGERGHLGQGFIAAVTQEWTRARGPTRRGAGLGVTTFSTTNHSDAQKQTQETEGGNDASSQIHWSGASCMHGWVHVPDKPNKERALHRHDFPLEKQGEQPSCATDCHKPWKVCLTCSAPSPRFLLTHF